LYEKNEPLLVISETRIITLLCTNSVLLFMELCEKWMRFFSLWVNLNNNIDNPVHYRLLQWMAQGNHLYKSYCSLLLPWLWVPGWFDLQSPGWKIASMLGIERTMLILSSCSVAFDLSVMRWPFWSQALASLWFTKIDNVTRLSLLGLIAEQKPDELLLLTHHYSHLPDVVLNSF